MSDSLPSPFDLPPAPPPAAPAGTAHLEFSGRRGDFIRLVSRGALLELLTVGFYRFWLATDMRRHLWSNTSVNGDSAEYTGTAKELLIGFLFALAILAPLYLVYFLLGIEAETWQAFASVPLGLFFYVFAQFAMYRARRYRLTRTIWRGLRFWMTGSGWAYAWRASLWGLWVLLTLGLALPWQKAALERYKMKHTAYGDLKGEFIATGGQLFRKGWWLWLLAWPSVVLVIPLPFIYAAFKAIEWRWWASGLRMGDVHLTSDLPRGALIGLYWKIIGWSLLILAAYGLFAGGISMVAYASIDASLSREVRMVMTMQQIWVLVALGAGYLITALAIGAVTRIYLMRDVWARVAQSITVHNLATAENVAARGEADNALGEGFADSLDVVGI
jgi:uncharacterized membrane protein YjgN (DUF898 family)